MPTLTQIGNGAIQGASTTLANADVDKAVSGDKLVIFDTSTSLLKRVSASGLGGGATGGGSDAVFYLNDQTVTTDFTIAANQNAVSAGEITIANGITVTISGELSVV